MKPSSWCISVSSSSVCESSRTSCMLSVIICFCDSRYILKAFNFFLHDGCSLEYASEGFLHRWYTDSMWFHSTYARMAYCQYFVLYSLFLLVFAGCCPGCWGGCCGCCAVCWFSFWPPQSSISRTKRFTPTSICRVFALEKITNWALPRTNTFAPF